MDVAEWQRRLEENFTVNGTIGGNLFEVFDLENACGEYFARTFHGQSVLIDSFQSFYIETIKIAYKWIADHGWPERAENYLPLLLFYVVNFRGFRACENLLIKGYPLNGYSMLRDLKDRAIFIGAIANNITTFPNIYGHFGTKAINDKEWKKLKNKRKKEEYRVLGKMIRKESGLPSDIIEELAKWEQLFHEEVHGSKFTFFLELGEWLRTSRPPSIGPLPNEKFMAMYMNRSVEIGWMLVRLLPYIQPVSYAFGEEWTQKQKILDDSFRLMEKGLSELGKKVADAFIYFIDQKFKYPDDFCYFEADGTS